MNTIDDRQCFVCGPDNPDGLQVVFSWDPAERSTTGRIAVPRQFSGWSGVVHGGIVSALLDEAMAKAAMAEGCAVVTAELTVRFLRPVPVGVECRLSGRITEKRRKLLQAESALDDGAGELYAAAAAKLFVTSSP